MKKFNYILMVLLLAMKVAVAQDKVVQGTVADKDGPLAGATITEKGAAVANVTMTDANGNFKLTLKGSSNVLVISSVGYITREVSVANAPQGLRINLEQDVTKLDDVVIIGYGQQKKVTVTGSVSTVSGEAIRQNPSASLQNALVGNLPGFFSQQTSGQPGADGANFYIRGVSSFAGGATVQPLIIIDDIEFTYAQFARLDPNEIESVSILKDASMTAVYGIKGANGVVLVTTRRGKIGKPQLTFRTETSLQQPTKIPEYLGAYESALLHNQAALNDGVAPIFNDVALEAFRTGSDPYLYPDVNWKDVLFKDFSLQFRNNIDISGGTERVRYFVSLGNIWQNGMLKNFGEETDVNNSYYHNRYNYRSNIDLTVNKGLKLKLDLYGNLGQVNTPNYSHPNGADKTVFYEYSSYLSLSPFAYPLTNPNGSFGYLNNLQPNRYNVNNIAARLTYGGYRRNIDNNMNFNATADQRLDFLTKGLSAKATVAYASTYGYTRNITRSSFPAYIWNPNNDTYTPNPAGTFRIQRYFLEYGAGSTTRTLGLQGSLNYDRTFSADHHVGALLLYNRKTALGASNAFIPSNFKGFSGRVNYDYKNKYLLQLTGAYNGTDQFLGDKRYGFFPAASAGWNISEEPFFSNNLKFIDRMKIRGSYGLVGQDLSATGQYAYTQTYSTNGSASFGFTHNNYNGIAEGTLANNKVTWEKQKEFGIGADIDLLKTRLGIVYDYFNNDRYDILTTRGTVSQVFGQGLPPVNLGKVNNKGHELEIRWNDHIGKNWKYHLRGQYATARNKVVFRDEAQAKYPWLAQTGKTVGTQLAYQWIGFYKSAEDIASSPTFASQPKPGDLKYADLNGDGILNDFDKAYSGDPANVPPVTYSFETGMSYKNFGFRVLFAGAKDFVASAVAEQIQFLGSNMLPAHQQAWTPELGDNALYPRLSLSPGTNAPLGFPSTFWLVPGDYLRLKTAELNYSIPASIIKRLKVQSARVYATGNNLLTWSKLYKRYDLDPEIASGSSNVSYPPQRIYNLGISVTF